MSQYFVFAKPHTNVDERDAQIVTLPAHIIHLLPASNTVYYVTHGLFESSLIEWCKQFCSPTKMVVDAGAHTGTYALSLAAHASSVHAFEPQRATFNALCGGIALSNLSDRVIPHRCGLGSADQVGAQVLSVVSVDGGGSTLHADNHTVLKTETIDVRTLDSFGFTNVGFLKLDVEENELNVLRGSVVTLRTSGYPPFLFECNRSNPALMAFVYELGYGIAQLNGCSNMFLATRKPL